MKMALVDYAAESQNFEAFKAAISEFFDATDEAALAEREEARSAVRAGKLDRQDLRKEVQASGATLRVELLRLEPDQNLVDGMPSPSLAA